MRRFSWLLLCGAGLLGACAPDGAVTLPGATDETRIAGAVDRGPVAADTPVDVVLGLRLHNDTQLHKFIDDRVPGDDLAPRDFADRFAPSGADYARVLTWLRARGLHVTRTVAGRTTVSVSDAAGAIGSAFGTELHLYEDARGSFVAAAQAPRLPPEVASLVSGVVGLDDSDGWRSHLVPPPAAPEADPSGHGAADLRTMYNAASVTELGEGETVAILGTGTAPDAVKDVGAYLAMYKPAGVAALADGQYHVTLLGGANRDSASLANNEYIENVLDAEMVLAFAPHANVEHVMVATNSPGLFTDGIAYMVNQVGQAHQVSVSYGSCERGRGDRLLVVNTLLAQAQAQGQQWFFAAGDSGSDGCDEGPTNKLVAAGWPASSPYAIGVGGTQIGTAGEVVWRGSGPRNAGGGAPSETFAKPAYQSGVTPADDARDTPDVAALAGSPGVAIVFSGAAHSVGGTSAAAPMWAGIWAVLCQHKGHQGVTDALTKLYSIGRTDAFHDIVTGDNRGPDNQGIGYRAGPGYDLATGWGSPNVAQLLARMP